MYSEKLSDYIISENDTIADAYWKYKEHNKILIVVDKNDMFSGVITSSEMVRGGKEYDKNDLVSLIVNRDCKTVQFNGNEELLYGNVRNIFADNLGIHYIPILKEGNVVDIFSRKRAFWLKNLAENSLPYNHYANGLYEAAHCASVMGYRKISAIEFGVAGGNGLRMLESHAKEISRILKIDIEVYGFDTGKGLPDVGIDYRNLMYAWEPGSYQMDVEILKKRLSVAKLIIGDISETLSKFIQEYCPAPIGFISVDVDFYTSTVPILNFLANISEENSMPRINIYFDDIYSQNDYQGEYLAIKEFNKENEYRKISPEIGNEKLKILHNFKHHLYNNNYHDKFEQKHSPGVYI